jgi:large subunit ribosomal protein L4
MATIEIKDATGKASGNANLNDAVFAIEPNLHVMHRTVTAQRAAWRQGTSAVKNRSAVRGGGKKPWRQKGTGRARAGSSRSPIWRGGGVVFGPLPRDYSKKVNKKEIKLAMRSALSSKFSDSELIVIKALEFETPSTKKAVEVLDALECRNERITLIIPNDAIEVYLSFRNLQNVDILPVNDINAYELIDNKKLVIVEDCLEYIEEVLG